ncbi:TetR/AcrR family transcriptional regulator [Nocardia sp. NBC_00511]|uniref:TetR/AcrR family transcriptional regulator n=1 Tax=Nocardia sp. NBC_00511 TaxID=2903591 RepID=UPI0030E0B3C2
MVSGSDRRALGDPVRGTRPANRRQLIVRAATDLFYEKGYAKVAISDVAEAVAIGPSALYRHFRSKQDLLAAVVSEALSAVDGALNAATADNLVSTVAAAALEHRPVGVLVRRESRQLPADDRLAIRQGTKRVGARLAELLRERRPELSPTESDLLAWCTLTTTNSLSLHSLSLPEPGFTALIEELLTTIIDAPITLPDQPSHSTEHTPALVRRSRREAILTEAIRLFARNGFAAVSMEDIGAAVGISGPSVYNHFPAKSDILVAAMFRGDEWLQVEMNRAFAHATDARDGLQRLLTSYSEFAFESPELIELLVAESMHLPDTDRHRARAAQHSYIAEWVYLTTQIHPTWDPVAARIRVQATQTMMNDIALMPHLRTRPGVLTALHTIAARLLAISAD